MAVSAMQMERDGRALSAMGSDTKLVHAYLESWARWARNQFSELGLPQVTYLKRWETYGIDGAQQHGKPPTMPDDIALTDAAVSRLGSEDKQVIFAYYLSWAPREIIAKQCQMTNSKFDATLKRARWRIEFYRIGRADQQN